MSGPQGSDPTQQPWSGQQPEQPADQQPSDPNQQWQPPVSPADATQAAPQWQPPAYDPQQQQYGYQAPAYGQPQYSPPQSDFSQQQTYVAPGFGQQPGQYPQFGQQPGQFGQQPGQYPPGYAAPGSDQEAKKSMAIIFGVVGVFAAIVVAVVLVLGFWKPGFFVETMLDIDAAQTGVQRILTDQTNGYGAKNVEDVKCNNGENVKVQKGATFECEVSIDGTKRTLTVTFQDDDGTYEVGRPR